MAFLGGDPVRNAFFVQARSIFKREIEMNAFETKKSRKGRSAKEVIAMAKELGVQIVDYKFMDLPGTLQHISYHIDMLKESVFTEGIGFDGSSIRGFKAINESDMLLVPDPDTAVIDPCCKTPTLSMFCEITDPMTREPYGRDPRGVAKRAEAFLAHSGIATHSFFGPEAEFFVFDGVRFDQNQHSAFYYIDSGEGAWNSGRDEKPNLAYKVRYKEGYFPCPPTDTLQEFRTQAMLRMREMGLEVEIHHHEVATAGQCEMGVGVKTLTKAADQIALYKYVLKNVAREHFKVVTFMPKPIFQDNGNGMHCHQSLWKGNEALFYDKNADYAHLSQLALWYIGGLLKHAPALLAITSPTTNSYRRLVPGYEAPVNLVYSARNRSAICRIPTYSDAPKAKRVEFRAPDATCNPYLAFSAMMMAGLDGILNKIDPGAPADFDLFEATAEQLAEIKTVPDSLQGAIEALEKDHEFLLRGGVFTEDLLKTYITFKKKKEIDYVRLRPHPAEFQLYFDA
jgi:glutamine synthetase